MSVLKTILLGGCVISGILIFISATVGFVLTDSFLYISRWISGKYMGSFSLALTNRFFEEVWNLWPIPIFALGGLCIGFIYAWQNFKNSLKIE